MDAHHSPLPAPRTESPRAPDLASPLVVWPAAAEAKLDGSCVGILDDGDDNGGDGVVDNVLRVVACVCLEVECGCVCGGQQKCGDAVVQWWKKWKEKVTQLLGLD